MTEDATVAVSKFTMKLQQPQQGLAGSGPHRENTAVERTGASHSEPAWPLARFLRKKSCHLMLYFIVVGFDTESYCVVLVDLELTL